MYGCNYCKMNGNKEEYCALTGELTKGAVMCDFEFERCPEYQNALKPIKPKPEPKSTPTFIQTSIFGAAGEKPFFGSGAVFFKKPSAYIETINDVNGDIVNLFKVCRERPEELAAVLELTPWAREEFWNCYEIKGDEVERARRLLVRYHQSFGTANISVNSWRNSQTYKSPRTAEQWNCLPEIVRSACGRLKQAQIENIDALTLIERYNDPNTLLYLDPPYLRKLRKPGLYKNEMATEQHEQLLELLLKSKSKICLSAYDSELYNEQLKGWYTDEKLTRAQMGLHRTEKLYMNYEPDLLAMANKQIEGNNENFSSV